MHFCPQCGAAAAPDAKFCAECGTSLSPQPAPPVAPAARRSRFVGRARLPRIVRALWPHSGVSMGRELILVVLYAVALIFLLTRIAAR